MLFFSEVLKVIIGALCLRFPCTVPEQYSCCCVPVAVGRHCKTCRTVGFANLSPGTVVLKTRAFSKVLQLDINSLYIKNSLIIDSQFSSEVRVRRWC